MGLRVGEGWWEATCRSVLGKGGRVTQGEHGLAFHWQVPRKAPHLSWVPLPAVLPSPCAWSGEAMMNFPQTALQTVINNALLFGDGTFH